MQSIIRSALSVSFVSVTCALLATNGSAQGANWKIVGWNDLGMHCMDSDYSVFSILPPYNTINAQVIDNLGHLVVTPGAASVSYRAVADPTGSINVTSGNKTNFWTHVRSLYGANVPVDLGIAGTSMPGVGNNPRPMSWVPGFKWFNATGVPITPVDDAGNTQNYPMMRLEARDAAGVLRGSTSIVLPVSSEMDCRACHASGAPNDARPFAGWANDPNLERDYRLNILRLHDELQAGDALYTAALAHFGFNVNGLYDTVTVDSRSILCGSCHGTNALASPGFGAVSSLTSAIHSGHANVNDPITHMSLGSSDDRSACYRCHPGSETRCLRGTMGNAVAPDGSMSMQCQSCHGDMAKVGNPARQGWFQEPACQSCHTGSATSNNGQIRYESSFDVSGNERVAVNALFATNANTPATGLNLYRFSSGHGGLQCEACHGSTHAEYPSSHANDNVQSVALQGHAGLLVECTACHASMPNTVTGGPHGMHPVGADWALNHADAVEQGGSAQCRSCHGTDYRGTVLSRAQGARSFTTNWGTKQFFDGYAIGCYDCHNGPNGENSNPNHRPVVASASATTPAGVPVPIALSVTDADGQSTTLRIVTQTVNGTVSLNGTAATYFPYAGFAGVDTFTYSASDGQLQSTLGTVTITVTANWDNYGEGSTGTLGVPDLSLGAVPRLGTVVPIHFGNSSGIDTSVIVLVGTKPGYQPTPFGGTLLVSQAAQRTMLLSAGGGTRFFPIPSSPQLVGFNFILQTIVLDPGVPSGRAYSRAMRMVFGN
ncbi:MAG: Ig-like domain-containing protein [Planctomycetota bacterium]|nr:Ig-like domain-containing protein [Planctomycetota bacterium]